jgi:hypothetical protein
LLRRADAQALAGCVGETGTRPELLADLIDLLRDLPEGVTLLQAARQTDLLAVSEGLEVLSARTDLPGRLHHHLALLAWRAAHHRESDGDPGSASALWRRAWRSWLALLAGPESPPEPARGALLDHLLGEHARRISDLLARGKPEPARQHWDLVQSLPSRCEEMTTRVTKFRDDLATEYLLTTREAMRHGAVPEGWRADYDRGLTLLCRLLSLDRDNVRLLTALVEICDGYFLDLYHTEDRERLREQVKRFTPFALQLARLSADRPAELPARSALAEFWKFRGFVESDAEAKVALYREALRLDPSNANVRELLAELVGSDAEGEEEEEEEDA